MLTLCGTPISNYYNKVKLALLEKGVPFTEERCDTGRPSIAGGSPMGKVPFLRTPHGVLSESIAISEYIEDLYPDTPLFPRDPYARAKCRELVLLIELYLELPARLLHPEVYFGGKVSEEVKQTALEELEKGLKAVAQVAKFSPFLTGSAFTYADCAAFAHMPLISQCTKKMYGEDFATRIGAMPSYIELVRSRPNAKKVIDDRKAYIAAPKRYA